MHLLKLSVCKYMIPGLVCAILLTSSACVMAADTLRTDTTAADGSRIGWDYSTLRRISPATGARYSTYARMIQLKDGSLMCAYERDGNTVVVKSIDGGNSWSAPIVVAAKIQGCNMSVPDILELKSGALLVSYNPRPNRAATDLKFGISIKKSYDKGQTWTDERKLYEAQHLFEDGCWEPSAIQLPDGEIQLFFSNEGIYTHSNEQNISVIRSTDDGKTWTTEPQIVSFRAGHRDGMPAPLLLKNGKELVFSIEDNGPGNFKPSIIRTTLKNNWANVVTAESADRNIALATPVPDKWYLGAPYLRQINSGETILSYQGTEGRTNDMKFSEMKVAVGNNEARLFGHVSVPFNIPPSKSGLWNSLSILNDNTVVALTATGAFSANGAAEVWMIKGHVIPPLTAAKEKINNIGPDAAIWQKDFPVFVGHKGQAQLKARVSSDQNFLYVLTNVRDSTITNTPDNMEQSDGVQLLLAHPEKASAENEGNSIRIFISAANQLLINGVAMTSADNKKSGMQTSTWKTAQGYRQKIAIPWALLSKDPAKLRLLTFNIGLTNHSPDKPSANYQEFIDSCDEKDPSTWLTLRVR